MFGRKRQCSVGRVNGRREFGVETVSNRGRGMIRLLLCQELGSGPLPWIFAEKMYVHLRFKVSVSIDWIQIA